jgi:hypothetical protein
VLFGLLEARHCSAPEPAACESTVPVHDTAAIAGLDGYAVGKSSFTARQIPPIGNAATLLDVEGTVVAGALYFVDGAGTVRRLSANGAVTVIAKFPITSSQQSISFGVSPDGKAIIAAVLTYPINTPPTSSNQPPWGTFSGPWRLQIEKVTANGAAVILHQWQANTTQYPNAPDGFANIWIAGWDDQGPIALVGQATGTQNAWLNNQRYFSGHFAHLNADGTAGAPIGPADCLPYWRPVAGHFVCSRIGSEASTPMSVLNMDGSVLWNGVAPQSGQGAAAGDFSLSADGTRLAMDGEVVTLANNSVLKVAANFQPQGWLDPNTLIGWIPVNGPGAPHMGIVHLNDPLHPEDWGFSGAYVGLLSS